MTHKADPVLPGMDGASAKPPVANVRPVRPAERVELCGLVQLVGDRLLNAAEVAELLIAEGCPHEQGWRRGVPCRLFPEAAVRAWLTELGAPPELAPGALASATGAPAEQGKLLTIAEAAGALNLTEGAVRRACGDGRIRAVEYGPRTIRISHDEIRRIIAAGGLTRRGSAPAAENDVAAVMAVGWTTSRAIIAALPLATPGSVSARIHAMVRAGRVEKRPIPGVVEGQARPRMEYRLSARQADGGAS